VADKELPAALFGDEKIPSFLRHLQEATRATPDASASRYIPPSGGEIADSNYHHFVFGQRGSGKSSLLRHLEAQMQDEGRASAWLDQEVFSNLNYPDVLVSAVHGLMAGVLAATRTAHPAPKVATPPWWQRCINVIVRNPPPPISHEQAVISALSGIVDQLTRLKFAPLDRKIEWTIVEEANDTSSFSAGAKLEVVTAGAQVESGSRSSATRTEVVEGSKEQYLERALTNFREVLGQAASLVSGGFIFVDDLYQLRRSDQPLVLGYLHRLVKDTGFWLKIGSIRYSTVPFRPGDPPRGMQPGHDAHEVPLDRGLRYFTSTQTFLESILTGIASTSGVSIQALFTEDSRKRLVLAAGGVARDYLRLASGAVAEARNRGVTTKPGSHRVIVEDVNKAAGGLSPTKFTDLREDEPDEAAELERLVRQLTEFCRTTKAAYFLVAADDTALSTQVNKLQHLRFAHLLAESETIPNRGSQRFNVWLLDVAELSAQRATQGMDFLGWESREKRRNRKLIFSPTDRTEQVEQI